MSSRPNESPHASAALAGLGLTTQLATAATDSIPIAKLVLGVVSRIITLAEDIETSRDVLHQLAESARTMGLSISAVVAGRKLNPEVERKLEVIYEVLRSIEALFTRHKAKSAFHKALSYAFTTKKRVESLSQELSRATQELLCIAVVDTNAQVREDSRYIGEFRRIRLCDVDELKVFMEHKPRWTGYSSQIYSGRFEGKVVVLRFLKQNSDSICGEWDCRRVTEHDRLLEELSKDPNLHRNIARLYGRNSQEHFDRFNVMKSACLRISRFDDHPVTIESTWNIISQLVVRGSTTMALIAEAPGQDAACWLEDKGLSWYPTSSKAVFTDGADAPIIGLHNDLRSCDAKEWHIWVLRNMLNHAYSAHWEQSLPSDHALDVIFGTAPVPERIYRYTTTVPRRLIPTLSAKISAYITNAVQSVINPYDVWGRTAAVILHAAASGFNVGSTFFYTKYHTNTFGPPSDDCIFMARVEESDDELVHWTVQADISTSMAETFRKQLEITVEGPTDSDILESYGDPAEPASMGFTSRYPRGSA